METLYPTLTRHQYRLWQDQTAATAPNLERAAARSADAAFSALITHGPNTSLSHERWCREVFEDEAAREHQRMLYHLKITPTMAERYLISALNPAPAIPIKT